MKLERGLHVCGLRMRLILQSEDGDTHSEMTDRIELYRRILERMQAVGDEEIRASPPSAEPEREAIP